MLIRRCIYMAVGVAWVPVVPATAIGTAAVTDRVSIVLDRGARQQHVRSWLGGSVGRWAICQTLATWFGVGYLIKHARWCDPTSDWRTGCRALTATPC